jgi:hypothetical protein
MKVCWHVDDQKVSHVDPKENTRFGDWLSETYGMTVVARQGAVHDYLEMMFDFSVKGKVMINMIKYIKIIIANIPDSEGQILGKAAARRTSKGISSCLCPTPFFDIQPATTFLTTQVRCPDEDDWGKVKRLLEYLKGTLNMPLVLLLDLLTLSRWWVDVVYEVYDDCRGHTGAGMSLGQGMALSYSWKQKINTKSSTKVELVGVDDSLGYILWACYFMQEQGFDMEALLLYQDNMSAMLLETNDRASSSKRTKQIKVNIF